MTPFDYVNAINFTKEDLFKDNPKADKEYNQFLVNRALSYFSDTVLHANEMNKYHGIANDMQFDFLRMSINKKKRFSKWAKKQQSSDAVEVIKEIYGYSDPKALEVADLFDEDRIAKLKESLLKGGR